MGSSPGAGWDPADLGSEVFGILPVVVTVPVRRPCRKLEVERGLVVLDGETKATFILGCGGSVGATLSLHFLSVWPGVGLVVDKRVCTGIVFFEVGLACLVYNVGRTDPHSLGLVLPPASVSDDIVAGGGGASEEMGHKLGVTLPVKLFDGVVIPGVKAHFPNGL